MSSPASGRRRERKTASRSSFLLVAGSLLLLSSALSATTIVPVRTDELAALADAIVHGVVVSTSIAADADGRPETVTVIAPLEIVKGTVGDTLVLRQLGGRLPDGTFLQLWGRPEYDARPRGRRFRDCPTGGRLADGGASARQVLRGRG